MQVSLPFEQITVMTLECTMLADDVTPNFNNHMLMAALFLDIEKVFNTTWCFGLLYKMSELEFSTSLIKLMRACGSVVG
jgi:hypothetical protein